MGSSSLANNLPKLHHVGGTMARRSTWNPRVFLARSLQTNSPQDGSLGSEKVTPAMNQGANEENMGDKASYTTEPANQKTRQVASNMSESAQDIAAKAKQTMQEAWNATKETAQKAKDTVVGKAEESKESMKENAKEAIKENAETVKRCMNTKN